MPTSENDGKNYVRLKSRVTDQQLTNPAARPNSFYFILYISHFIVLRMYLCYTYKWMLGMGTALVPTASCPNSCKATILAEGVSGLVFRVGGGVVWVLLTT